MLIDELKKANVEALKQPDKLARAIYNVILSKCQIVLVEKRANNQDFLDADVLQILSKLTKELEEEKENYAKVNNVEEVNNINYQIDIVKSYLPTMLSDDEIIKEINKLEDKSIGNIMRYFKTNFAGKVDMAKVQQIFKTL